MAQQQKTSGEVIHEDLAQLHEIHQNMSIPPSGKRDARDKGAQYQNLKNQRISSNNYITPT